MAEQNLGVYLTDAERDALDQQRTLDIARALQMQAHLLFLWGVNEEDVQVGVDAMRNRIQDASDDELKKVRKALSKTVQLIEAMQPVASVTPLPVQEVVHPVEERQLEQPEQPKPSDVVEDEVSHEDQDEVIDETKPKELSPSLNNAFGKSFTYGQRATLSELSEEQQKQFVDLFEGMATSKGSKRIAQNAETYALWLEHMLKGISNVEIAKLTSAHNATISNVFSKILPPFIHDHKREFVEGYTKILATTPDLLEQASLLHPPNAIANVSETTRPERVSRPKREKISHPDGVDSSIDNALVQVLSFEQRASIATFTEDQREELVLLFDKILGMVEGFDGTKDRWVGRFEQLLGGVAMRDVGSREGYGNPIGIIKGFSSTIPSALARHRDEFIAAFEDIRAMTSEQPVSEGMDDSDEIDTVTDSAEVEVVARPDDSREILTVDATQTVFRESLDSVHDRAFTTVPAHDSPELNHHEKIVDQMQDVLKVNDELTVKGIRDLFLLDSDGRVVPTTEETIQVSLAFAKLLRDRGIKLHLIISNPHGRGVVSRLVNGISQEGGDTKWATLSEIIDGTPEGMRQTKLVATQNALEKIAKTLEGSVPARLDINEERINEIRTELYKYIDLKRELANRIIDRALGSTDGEFTGELSGGLVQLYRVAVGVGLTEDELKVMRLFASPVLGRPSLTVSEIKKELEMDIGRSRAKAIDDSFISGILIRSFNKIIVQRRDG